MSGGIAGGIAEILGRKNFSKGVKVEVGEKEAAIGCVGDGCWTILVRSYFVCFWCERCDHCLCPRIYGDYSMGQHIDAYLLRIE